MRVSGDHWGVPAFQVIIFVTTVLASRAGVRMARRPPQAQNLRGTEKLVTVITYFHAVFFLRSQNECKISMMNHMSRFFIRDRIDLCVTV